MPSWQPDKSVERPDGSLVCNAHGLVVCGVCTVDYSFMQDNLEEDQQNHGGHPEPKDVHEFEATYVPTLPMNVFGYHQEPGHVAPDVSNVFPAKFQPPNTTDTPESLFVRGIVEDPAPYRPAGQKGVRAKHHRFMSRSGEKDFLIFTDGACLGNGQANPTAGCAFVFRPANTVGHQPVKYGTFSLRLENRGPKGDPQSQTSNRAELRAAIAAIQFRIWVGEGWERLIIATDSEYVVKGATEWIQGWQRKGWVTAKKEPVKNRDLWELLLKEVRNHAAKGLEVLFWAIPREQNSEADEAAKKAAEFEEVPEFVKYTGFMCRPDEMATMEKPYEETD
jgi:ribonuclease HI